jgi:hypothetical protein
VIHAYVNYPNARVSLHGTSCGHIQQAQKSDQRRLRLDDASIATELQKFSSGQYAFASHAAANDMWLDVEFDDSAFEEAVVRHIHRLLSRRYKPFGACSVEWHCR